MIRKQVHITEFQKTRLEKLTLKTGLKEAENLRRALEIGLKILEKELE